MLYVISSLSGVDVRSWDAFCFFCRQTRVLLLLRRDLAWLDDVANAVSPVLESSNFLVPVSAHVRA